MSKIYPLRNVTQQNIKKYGLSLSPMEIIVEILIYHRSQACILHTFEKPKYCIVLVMNYDTVKIQD